MYKICPTLKNRKKTLVEGVLTWSLSYENNVYLFLTSCGEIFPNIIISSLSDSLNPYENLIWSGVVINTDSDSPNQNLNDINSNSFEEFSNEFFFLKTKKLGNV